MRADAVANRKRVLAAAEEVFAERGTGAPTEEVARRAGVGVGTVFRHFPTKRELVAAILVARLDDLTAQAGDLVATSDAAAALDALLREAVRTGRTTMALARDLRTAPEELPDAPAAAFDRLRTAVAELLAAAQSTGDVRDDVDVDDVYFLLRGLAQAQDTAPAADATRRRALDVVLDGLAPAGPQSTGRSR